MADMAYQIEVERQVGGETHAVNHRSVLEGSVAVFYT